MCICHSVYPSSHNNLTIKYSTAVLSGGGQGFACRIHLVAIVADANLELDRFTGFLQHARTVEHCTEGVLPLSLVLLYTERKRFNSM